MVSKRKTAAGWINRSFSLPKQADQALRELARKRAAGNMDQINISGTLRQLILEAWQRENAKGT